MTSFVCDQLLIGIADDSLVMFIVGVAIGFGVGLLSMVWYRR